MFRSPHSAAESESATETARLDGVDFGYADGPDVLKDINLTLPRGSFHFITGSSGAGKSSLLRLLFLAQRPRSGRLMLFGRDTAGIKADERALARRRMGLVTTDFGLLDHLSVFDNVALPLRLADPGRPVPTADVQAMLNWVGLGDRAHTSPRALSGGERRKLAVARAVIAGPELILADDPTDGVDSPTRDRLLKLLVSLNANGATVVVAGHDEALADRSGARVLRLSQGRLSVPTA